MNKPCKKCGGTERWKNGSCAPCGREYARLDRLNNPEKVKERSRRWRKNNPEKEKEYYEKNREKILARIRQRHANYPETSRLYYNNHREKFCARARRRYKDNPEREKALRRRWKKNNLGKRRAYDQRRRARKNKVISRPYDFKAICTQYGNKCLRCDRNDIDLTVDHVIPISWGGPDTADNIQPLCLSCNAGKGNHRATDYRPENRPPMYIQLPLFEAKSAERNGTIA